MGGYEKQSDIPLLWSALSGSVAGVAYWALPFPADTIKSKLQSDSRYFGMSFSQACKTICREEGPRGLYRGCGITCARAMPSHALIFYFYAMADNFLKRL